MVTPATRLLPLTVNVCAADALPITVLKGPPGTSAVVVITGGGTMTVPLRDTFCVAALVDVNVILPVTGPKGAVFVIRVYIYTGWPISVPPLCGRLSVGNQVILFNDIS